MKYILDSNIGVKWVLEEDHSDKARALRDDFIRSLASLP